MHEELLFARHAGESLMVFSGRPAAPMLKGGSLDERWDYNGIQLWPKIPVISTKKTPFIECIIP